jgi:2-polyprenyl-3-methyl-5-hydroxy-6-metoxy-1,4-benzoquinol methylase
MAISSKNVKRYFEDNAALWVLDGYKDEGYNYPVAFHRARIVTEYLSRFNKKKLNILDLGCGGGNLTFSLAKSGFYVTGVDQSKSMLKMANEKRSELPKSIQDRTKFLLAAVDKLRVVEKFDIVIAMGFIGYFKNDKYVFDIVSKLLKPGGYFIVSSRNQLFNMTSISFRTKNEIKRGTALNLVREIEKYYQKVPTKYVNQLIKNFKRIVINLPNKPSGYNKPVDFPSQNLGPYKSVGNFEPRQSTPESLKKTAQICGFKHKAYFGVHPHLLDPNLNKLLPPQLFNKLSDSLEAFEHLPISLVWSSAFIGVFKKQI